MTSPSLCTSGHERVYITAFGCEICFGPMHGIEQFSVFRFEAATAFLNFITVLVMSLRLLLVRRLNEIHRDKYEVRLSVAVVELKFGPSCVVVFVQQDWLAHDFPYCLLVFLWQVVQKSLWDWREHKHFSRIRFHA